MNKEKLQKEIEEYINKYNLPYFDIVVIKNHKKVFQFGFNEGKPVLGDEVLAMYSMSKPITSAVILSLVEQGKIALNDPISKWFDSFKNVKIIKDGIPSIPCKKEITIEDCLAMQSGLDYSLQRPAILKAIKENPNISTADLINHFADDGILFEPGTEYCYGLSFDILAGIIEKVTNKKFSEYVKETIFNKLEMNNSTFENKKQIVDTFMKEKVLEDGEWKTTNCWYPGFMFSTNYECGGAGLISTVNDYSKFVDALACNGIGFIGNKVISSSSILDMRTIRAEKMTANIQYNGTNEDDYGYGLGVRVRPKKNSHGIPEGEFGWDGALGCYSLVDAENNISIVIGLNIQFWPYSLPGFHTHIANIVYDNLLK